jgi:intracellular sulfur oxidation DsrE/DsrF family protein
MNRMAWIGLLAAVGLGTAQAAWSGAAPEEEPLRVVVHINFPEPGRQGAGLKNITNILKGAPDTQVEVVCHGAGIGLVEKARTDHAQAIEELMKAGVKFVACENTMRQKSIRKEDILAGVGTVPSGAVEVIRKQQRDGFAYFKP